MAFPRLTLKEATFSVISPIHLPRNMFVKDRTANNVIFSSTPNASSSPLLVTPQTPLISTILRLAGSRLKSVFETTLTKSLQKLNVEIYQTLETASIVHQTTLTPPHSFQVNRRWPQSYTQVCARLLTILPITPSIGRLQVSPSTTSLQVNHSTTNKRLSKEKTTAPLPPTSLLF